MCDKAVSSRTQLLSVSPFCACLCGCEGFFEDPALESICDGANKFVTAAIDGEETGKVTAPHIGNESFMLRKIFFIALVSKTTK